MLSLEYTFSGDQFKEDIELTDADKPRLTKDSLVLPVFFENCINSATVVIALLLFGGFQDGIGPLPSLSPPSCLRS